MLYHVFVFNCTFCSRIQLLFADCVADRCFQAKWCWWFFVVVWCTSRISNVEKWIVMSRRRYGLAIKIKSNSEWKNIIISWWRKCSVKFMEIIFYEDLISYWPIERVQILNVIKIVKTGRIDSVRVNSWNVIKMFGLSGRRMKWGRKKRFSFLQQFAMQLNGPRQVKFLYNRGQTCMLLH